MYFIFSKYLIFPNNYYYSVIICNITMITLICICSHICSFISLFSYLFLYNTCISFHICLFYIAFRVLAIHIPFIHFCIHIVSIIYSSHILAYNQSDHNFCHLLVTSYILLTYIFMYSIRLSYLYIFHMSFNFNLLYSDFFIIHIIIFLSFIHL